MLVERGSLAPLAPRPLLNSQVKRLMIKCWLFKPFTKHSAFHPHP